PSTLGRRWFGSNAAATLCGRKAGHGGRVCPRACGGVRRRSGGADGGRARVTVNEFSGRRWMPAGRCGYEVNHVADTRLVPPLFRDRCVANGSRTASARAAAVGGAASSPDVGQGTGSKGGRGCPAVGTTTECVGSGISTLPVSTRAASSRTAPPPRGVIRRCGPAV